MNLSPNTVIYQIYPKSFYDADGDGFGDFVGIVQKFDYLKSLGVGTLLLSGVFVEPKSMKECRELGYLVPDPQLGGERGLQSLLKSARLRGFSILLEAFVSDTSPSHPWFREACLFQKGQKRDFYFFKPAGDEPIPLPGDGRLWEYDRKAKAYCLCLHREGRVSLNWENEDAAAAVCSFFKRWSDAGVYGFSVGPPPASAEAALLPLSAPRPRPGCYYPDESKLSGYHSFESFWTHYLKEWDIEKCPVILGSEALPPPPPKYSPKKEPMRPYRPFLRNIMNIDCGKLGKYQPARFSLTAFKNELVPEGKALRPQRAGVLSLGGADVPRMLSRFGDDSKSETRHQTAKLLITLLMTLPGIPCIYQGDEIGMTNGVFSGSEELRSSECVQFFQEGLRKNIDAVALLKVLSGRGCDGARTPMQWTMEKNAGFSRSTPWIKVNPNHLRLNVQSQEQNSNSPLQYFRKAVTMRKKHDALQVGGYLPVAPKSEKLFCYLRHTAEEKLLVTLNMSGSFQTFVPIDVMAHSGVELLLCNYEDPHPVSVRELLFKSEPRFFTASRSAGDKKEGITLSTIYLRPYEARVYRFLPETEKDATS